jgi:hypothetical protein
LPSSGSPTTFNLEHSRHQPFSPSQLATSSQAQWLSPFWPSSLVCAGVLVICPGVCLAFFGHAPSLTSSLSLVEVEALPSWQVVLSCPSSVLWPPPTSHPASLWTSLLSLYHQLWSLWPTNRVRPLLFHRLLSSHPALPTPEGSSRLHLQVLHRFLGLRYR